MLATVLIIVVGKSVAAYRHRARCSAIRIGTALTISASLAQIGEFSFILAGLGVALGMLPPEARDLILAGAILSILVNPLLFFAVERTKLHGRAARPRCRRRAARATARPSAAATRCWSATAASARWSGKRLVAAGRKVVVIEDRRRRRRGGAARRRASDRRQRRRPGGAGRGRPRRRAAHLRRHPRGLRGRPGGRAGARRAKPELEILARAHSDDAVEHLTRLGATLTVMGEREIAHRMLERAMARGAHRSAGAA